MFVEGQKERTNSIFFPVSCCRAAECWQTRCEELVIVCRVLVTVEIAGKYQERIFGKPIVMKRKESRDELSLPVSEEGEEERERKEQRERRLIRGKEYRAKKKEWEALYAERIRDMVKLLRTIVLEQEDHDVFDDLGRALLIKDPQREWKLMIFDTIYIELMKWKGSLNEKKIAQREERRKRSRPVQG